jgi:thiamine biosynthesis lipoprotein
MNRRDFLHPRQFAQAAGQVLGAVGEIAPPALPPEPGADELPLLCFSHRAMATAFELLLPLGTPQARELAADAFDLLDALEAQLTVYRDSSEVSRLNRLAPQTDVPVEERLFGLLRLAARIHQESDGAFDVAAGALVKAWGFYRGPRRVPSEAELREALARTGMRHVELSDEGRRVRYRRGGLEINLGSIGKGYALDRVAERLAGPEPARARLGPGRLRAGNFGAGLLHGGHSSVYAKGAPANDPRGWPVGLSHPWRPERRLAVLYLKDQGLGTSAATFRWLEHQGRKLGHILDPRSGWPAEGVASATAVAPSAAEADALATAFYIQGAEAARRYCAAHPDVGAVLLPAAEGARPVVVGLPPAAVELS